jgi:hypothetical protein
LCPLMIDAASWWSRICSPVFHPSGTVVDAILSC